MSWKVGDWGIYDNKVVQIKEMKGGRVISVTDGTFNIGGPNMYVRPLTLVNKQIADCADQWETERHNHGVGFNYPDFHRMSVDLANVAMDFTEGSEEQKAACERLTKFHREVRDYLHEQQYKEIEGFYVWQVKR